MDRRVNPSFAYRTAATTRPAILLCSLGVALACGSPPNGRTTAVEAGAAERGSVDPRQVDVRGVVAFERHEGALEASLTYTLVPGRTEIGFLLNRGLSYEVSGPGVVGVEQSVSDMNADWNRLAVRFDSSTLAASTDVRFELRGAPVLPESKINQISSDWIELGLDAMWHPLVETIDRQYVADLNLVVPREWHVVSSGESETHPDGIRLRNTIPQVDIAFTAAPELQRIEEGNYALFHRNAASATTEHLLRRANDCRTEFDRRFGEQDPLPRGRFVMAERSESGYARKNYVVLTDTSKFSDAGLTEFLCHELAHYWSSRGAPFTVDNWLNEGFATLVGVQAVRQVVNREAYDDMVAELESRAQGLGSIWTPDDPSRRSHAVQYKKAPIALLRLEEHIGGEAFERFVRAYMAGVASTPELLETLEQLTDAGTREWFEAVLSEDDRADS